MIPNRNTWQAGVHDDTGTNWSLSTHNISKRSCLVIPLDNGDLNWCISQPWGKSPAGLRNEFLMHSAVLQFSATKDTQWPAENALRVTSLEFRSSTTAMATDVQSTKHYFLIYCSNVIKLSLVVHISSSRALSSTPRLLRTRHSAEMELTGQQKPDM